MPEMFKIQNRDGSSLHETQSPGTYGESVGSKMYIVIRRSYRRPDIPPDGLLNEKHLGGFL